MTGTHVPVTGIGYDCHRSWRGGGWSSVASRSRTRIGLLGHSDADVLPMRSSMPCSVRRRSGTSASTSPTPTSAIATPTRSRCCGRRRRAPAAGFAVEHVDATVVIEAPQLPAYPRRDAGRLARRSGSPEHVSVKATRGEGMGFVGRRRERLRWRWRRSIGVALRSRDRREGEARPERGHEQYLPNMCDRFDR